jgi:nucleoid-associated protein YgaU
VGTGSHEAEVATVVVVPGDCLWTIAADSLGRGTTNAEIAAEWPRWYEANRRVIGADPDLLLPGTVLRAPAAR